MREEIATVGIGGQGIKLIIEIFSRTLHKQGYNIASKPDYGAEVRGGKSWAYIVIKNKDQDWPEVMEGDILIALSQKYFEIWRDKIAKRALIFYDPLLVKIEQKKDHRVYYEIPATEIAQELKDRRVVNMAMLGGVIAITKLVSIADIIEVLKDRHKYSENNEKALRQGRNRVRKI